MSALSRQWMDQVEAVRRSIAGATIDQGRPLDGATGIRAREVGPRRVRSHGGRAHRARAELGKRRAFTARQRNRFCHGGVTKHRVAFACALMGVGMHMAKKPKKSDLRSSRERIHKQLIKRSKQLASAPARARHRHAQLIERRAKANPALVLTAYAASQWIALGGCLARPLSR